MSTAPAVTISVPVVYLASGNLNSPRPAIVDRVYDEGVCDLQLFAPGGGTTRLQRGVRHSDDPFHETNPSYKGRHGTYLTAKEYDEKSRAEVKRQQQIERERHLTQMRLTNDRIARLAKDGLSVMQIAAQVGVAEALVENVLRDKKITPQQTPQQPAGQTAS